jgi:hypothetical protein
MMVTEGVPDNNNKDDKAGKITCTTTYTILSGHRCCRITLPRQQQGGISQQEATHLSAWKV